MLDLHFAVTKMNTHTHTTLHTHRTCFNHLRRVVHCVPMLYLISMELWETPLKFVLRWNRVDSKADCHLSDAVRCVVCCSAVTDTGSCLHLLNCFSETSWRAFPDWLFILDCWTTKFQHPAVLSFHSCLDGIRWGQTWKLFWLRVYRAISFVIMKWFVLFMGLRWLAFRADIYLQ